MRSPKFFALLFLLILGSGAVFAQAPVSPITPAAADEKAAEFEKKRKAIEEAIKLRDKLQEARRKTRAAWEALPEQQRKKTLPPEDRLPIPEDSYNWRAEAEGYGLTVQDQAVLERQKFAIGQYEFLQSFEPYDRLKGPVFITSDALLNVYHVLFEDSFRELEIRRAGQLKTYLEKMFQNAKAVAAKLPFPATEYQPAWAHAQLAVGAAMRLLGTPIGFFDESVRSDIEAEVVRIREAKGPSLPKWLAPATTDLLAIDYGRFQPLGFYVGSRLLEDYFRAVRWLQLVPFRIERDNEFGAIALLGADLPTAKSYPYESYLKSYSSFLGQPDGRFLQDQTNILPGRFKPVYETSFHAQLDKAREWYKPSQPKVQDNLRLPKLEGAQQALEPFYLLASYALPETVFFQKLQNARKELTGLQFAAMNGSTWAYAQLLEVQKDEVLEKALPEVEKEAFGRYRGDLYWKYRRVIASLFEKADPDAPAFIASEAWAAKSTQTALASWVQMRHTFTLQTKISTSATCGFDRPPGFIEPNPTFLRAYVELIKTTKAKLDGFKLFEISGASVANLLREQADLCDEYVALSKRLSRREFEENVVVQKVDHLLQQDAFENMPEGEDVNEMLRSVHEAWRDGKLAEAFPKYSHFLRGIAEKYGQGKIEVIEKRAYASLKARWTAMEGLATRLETLLQKQLRKQDWNKDEADFIKGVGPQMAFLMGYFGNVHSPQDDAPRWVEIADYPDRGTLFAVATGRPRAFYVLYPWKGIEVLCTGSVFPYFEYEGKKRLTDAEWTQSLKTPDAVPLPGWAKSLYLGQ